MSGRDWTQSQAGRERYQAARSDAQRRANESGADHGVLRNDVFESFMIFRLPMRQHRAGSELRCEVVSCEELSKCQRGHGPQGVTS